MISYFVRYRGTSPDPLRFNDYYETKHAPILQQFSGIRSLILHRPVNWVDPYPVRSGGTMLLAQMVFDSSKALDTALHSDARRLARDDFRNFPSFDGEVAHEAMAAKVVF
jgi:uncharacterized protein (TIGR02118 family)